MAEIALALVLLIGAGLLIRSFRHLQRVQPGFERQGVLVLSVFLPESQYAGEPQFAAFYRQVLERINSLPDVRSASAVASVPLGDIGMRVQFIIENGQEHQANFQVASPHYFRTMGIPLLQGRDFTERDDAEAPAVALINQIGSRRIWPNESPLGKRISADDDGWVEIVGVVGDVRRHELELASEPELYFSQQQFPLRFADLVVKAGPDPLRIVDAVRSEVRVVDADLPVTEIRTMEQIVSHSVARPRFNTLLLGVFAAVALVLAAVGIYGLMAYSVSQRTHEIGIRIALGARGPDIYRLVVWPGVVLTGLGLAAGLAAAAALTRVLSGFLYGISATDPLTLAAVCALLALVALGASYLPARRAIEVDPLLAIRAE